jgi:hypothetical protein
MSMRRWQATRGSAFPRQYLRFSRVAVLLFAIITIPMVTHSWAGDATLTLELNKLEPRDKGCRAYMVINNPSESKFQTLKFDLIFFKPDGVIDRRLAIDVSPIYPNKKSVKTFDLEGIACDAIGTILLNEVMDCRSDSGPLTDCLAHLTLSTRAAAQFEK